MSIFKDEHYEQMDWLSQAIEPIDFNAYKLYSELPDRLDLTTDDLISLTKRLYDTEFSVLSLVKMKVPEIIAKYSSKDIETVCKQFKLSLPEGEKVSINLDTKTSDKEVFLLKSEMSDSFKNAVEKSFGKSANDYLYHNLNNHRIHDYNRCNDILKILDRPGLARDVFNSYLRSRSGHRKGSAIKTMFRFAVEENLFNIKNEDLLMDLAKWIIAYVYNGSTGAIANIYKLKVMAYDKVGIYSIKAEDY